VRNYSEYRGEKTLNRNYLILFIIFSPLACAQTFPTKSLRLVGIATPGTTSDIIGRAIGEPLSRRFGQSIVVDQRGGAGGTIAAGIVHRSEPDGHTLLLTSSAQSGMKWLYPALGFVR
jgi:tripartite-type tricarboxylate transporter receptor subunit TctC